MYGGTRKRWFVQFGAWRRAKFEPGLNINEEITQISGGQEIGSRIQVEVNYKPVRLSQASSRNVTTARLAATIRIPDANSLLNWAELTYPSSFEGPQPNRTLDIWTYRYYPKTNNYLGVNTSGDVLWLQGTATGTYNNIQMGKLADYTCLVYPSDCVPAPKSSGDVVGRELSIPGLSWAGHIGLFDGENVIEVLNEGGNTVKINTYDNFKARSLVWNPVYTKFSEYHNIISCWGTTCDLGSTGSSYFVGLAARYAVAKRAYQIYLIGADYTITTTRKMATPRYIDRSEPWWAGRPAVRGLYRCDTFVVDAFSATADVYGGDLYKTITGAPNGWEAKIVGLLSGVVTPASILEKIRNF